MKEFLTLTSEAFGLDISDLSLKIIKLKKKGKFFDLVSFGESEIEPGVIKEGEIKDEEKLAEIIKNAIKKVKGEKIKTKQVIASLPEEKAFLQVIQMPKMSEADLKSAVIYEAENYIPLPIQEVYLDSQIIHSASDLDYFNVLIAALPKKIVDSYLSCFKKAGLQPKVLEIESLAIARALIKNESTASSMLLIDLGATRTSFIIFSDHSLRFTSSISVSSQAFTEIISKNLEVDLAKAEILKIECGLEEKINLKIENGVEKKVECNKVLESLIPALTDLTEQIKKYLNYYHTHAIYKNLPVNGKKVTKILFCGGGANIKGLTNFFSNQLKIPVEIGNPWVNILPEPLKEVSKLSYEKSLSYTTALGLALRGIKEK